MMASRWHLPLGVAHSRDGPRPSRPVALLLLAALALALGAACAYRHRLPTRLSLPSLPRQIRPIPRRSAPAGPPLPFPAGPPRAGRAPLVANAWLRKWEDGPDDAEESSEGPRAVGSVRVWTVPGSESVAVQLLSGQYQCFHVTVQDDSPLSELYWELPPLFNASRFESLDVLLMDRYDDYDFGHYVLPAGGLTRGAQSLADAADRLRTAAIWLDNMQRHGWALEDSDEHGVLLNIGLMPCPPPLSEDRRRT